MQKLLFYGRIGAGLSQIRKDKMPIQYAIRTKRTVPLTRAEQYEYKERGYSWFDMNYSYEEVPFVVADMDEENGVYAFFGDNGTKLSDWMLVKKPEETEKAYVLGRQKPGSALHDSIGQVIQPGDYLYTHSHDHQNLELSQLVRTMRSKIIVEQLTDSHRWTKLRSRDPNSFIRIPTELMEGGTVVTEAWTKQYSVREADESEDGWVVRSEQFHFTDEATTKAEPGGHVGYFNSQNDIVSGWIPVTPSANDAKLLSSKVHAQKKVVDSLETPLTDIMGTDILLGDFVFSNDNHRNDFMLCEVIGFTKERVRLVGYSYRGGRSLRGYRVITLNWPKNIVKLPITMS